MLVVLALILFNAAHYAFTHYEGPTTYGDDPVYVNLAGQLLRGGYKVDIYYIFSMRIGQFAPIALYYLIFGVNTLTSSLWDITSYLGLVAVTFLAVRLIYDDRAALISSFLVSIYPLLTQYAVGTGEDPPLVFVGSLAVLLFLYAKDGRYGHRRALFFASGALLVFDWLIGVEAVVFGLFLAAYAVYLVARRKLEVDGTSLTFVYGISVALFIACLFSLVNAGRPFVFITGNINFYSAVGKKLPNGQATIPSADTDLMTYPNLMFQYGILNIMRNSALRSMPVNIYNKLLGMPNQPYYVPVDVYGIYYYLAVPAIALLLLLRERRSFFLLAWLVFMTMFLEFGPMSVSLSLSPLHLTYLLQHRLDRFMMVVTLPLAGIIGIALAKVLETKNFLVCSLGAALVAALLVLMFAQNVMSNSYHYYWQHYPESIVIQTANFLRYDASVNKTATIYFEGLYNGGLVAYSLPNFQSYLGYPTNRSFIYNIDNYTDCSAFARGGYVVWSGPAHCSNWIDVFNVTFPPPGIPKYFVEYETPGLVQTPTNVYMVG